MVLPSQSGRPASKRLHMFRKKRRARMPMLVGGAAVIGVGGFLLSRSFFSEPAEAGSGEGDVTSVAASGENGSPDEPGNGGGGLAPLEIDSSSNAGDARNADGAEAAEPPPIDWEKVAEERRRAAEQQAREDEQAQAARSKEERDERSSGEGSVEELQRAHQALKYAYRLKAGGNILEARKYFTQAMQSGVLTERDIFRLGVAMEDISNVLVFSPRVLEGDPFSLKYTIRSGDSLQKIVKDKSLLVDWRLIRRINDIRDVRRIRAGQEIKLITGPFHAVVDKSDFRLDLYLGDGEDRVFVRSFNVGLGEYNSTPTGMFKVSTRLMNPEWINPRTRERYLPDDPANPIGEHWLGLEGIDENTRDFTGYGIHGTIEPDSIGQQQSMGCVRLAPEDVGIVYECLLTDVSTVRIQQ